METLPQLLNPQALEHGVAALPALLTWGLAPTGFVAVGQSPGIYDLGESYKRFKSLG